MNVVPVDLMCKRARLINMQRAKITEADKKNSKHMSVMQIALQDRLAKVQNEFTAIATEHNERLASGVILSPETLDEMTKVAVNLKIDFDDLERTIADLMGGQHPATTISFSNHISKLQERKYT